MVREIIGGMTDYSHQSLDDIASDLDDERKNTIWFRDQIKANIEKAEANSYWSTKVNSAFTGIVYYALKFYETNIDEFAEISKEIKTTVKDHHVNRLLKISSVAMDINIRIGRIWGGDYCDKEYGNADFKIVEDVYCDTRDMAVNLMDVNNMAHRLKDFVGKEPTPEVKKNNPWVSGSFYLVLAVVLLAVLATIANVIHWAIIPLIVIGGILLVIAIGLLQLRNDDRISDKSFNSLLKQVVNQLPLLKSEKNMKD